MHVHAAAPARLHVPGAVFSGSWDKTVKMWDLRTKATQTTHAVPDRVYTMDLAGTKLVVGTASRFIAVFDVRNMSQPEQLRESALKYQTRSIRCFPSGEGSRRGAGRGPSWTDALPLTAPADPAASVPPPLPPHGNRARNT